MFYVCLCLWNCTMKLYITYVYEIVLFECPAFSTERCLVYFPSSFIHSKNFCMPKVVYTRHRTYTHTHTESNKHSPWSWYLSTDILSAYIGVLVYAR